jgi:hypothetical protein
VPVFAHRLTEISTPAIKRGFVILPVRVTSPAKSIWIPLASDVLTRQSCRLTIRITDYRCNTGLLATC